MVQSIGSLYFHGVVKGAPMIDGMALTRPALTAFRAANASDGQFLVRNRLPEIHVDARPGWLAQLHLLASSAADAGRWHSNSAATHL